MRLRSASLCLALSALAVACSDDRPPPLDDTPIEHPDAGADGAEPQDAALADVDPCTVEAGLVEATGVCGNLVYELEQQTINLYFVVDRSGSMNEAFGGAGPKYHVAMDAIEDVLSLVGHRVSFGASVFPGLGLSNQCAPGGEIFASRRGDRPGCPPVQVDALRATLEAAGAWGGTPTAAHLDVISPILKALEGNLSIILLTDGGANCNDDLTCTAEDCELSYSGLVLSSGQQCSLEFNCCDDALTEPGAHLNCIDFDATEAQVQELADFGIRTYVVGMPGSEHVAAHLSRLAELGGTARDQDPAYFPVSTAAELSEVFLQIGATVALSCDIALTGPPEDPALVNLYYDTNPVPFDAEGVEGWSWANDSYTAIRIDGSYCDTLEAGAVTYVQVQWGCVTLVY